MKRAIAWCAENHVAANLAMVVIIVAGLGTLPTLTQELIPSIELDTITVSVVYPGASPQEVESSITNRVEDELQGRAGIKRIRSSSAEGLSSVSAELMSGEDVRRRLDDIRAAIDSIDTFPQDAEEPLIQQLEIENRVLNVAVSGSVEERTLKQVGQQIRDEIAALPGVSDVQLKMARPYWATWPASWTASRRATSRSASTASRRSWSRCFGRETRSR